MREPRSEEAPPAHGRLTWSGLAVASVLTVVLGLLPGPFIDAVAQAARAIGG
jgi:NADH:ubiquinone oxidoreductase subunit 2 (subunit N)